MFEARNSPWRLLLLSLASFGFVVLGLWMLGVFAADHPTGLKATIVGWIATPFFAVCGLIALVRTADRGVVMRIDGRGIWWKQWTRDAVPWAAIQRVGVVTVRRQQFIGLALDPSYPMPSRGALRDKLAKANEAIVGFPLCLTVTGTDRRFRDLLEAVERYMPETLRG